MTRLLRTAVLGASLCLCPAFALAADSWTVEKAQSSVGFAAIQGEATFGGTFSEYDAEIAFSPDDLAGSRAKVSIDLSSVNTESADRDDTLQTSPWFDSGAHPKAVYEVSDFTKESDGKYVANGSLTLKDKTMPVVLPFSLTIDGDTATVTGETIIDRTNYGVGSGELADPSVVSRNISVKIDLTATRD